METNEINDQTVITQQSVPVKESDTKTTFGFSALTLPTPDKVKAGFKVATFTLWIVVLAANTFLGESVDLKIKVLEVAGFVTLVMQKAEDFFGIKIS